MGWEQRDMEGVVLSIYVSCDGIKVHAALYLTYLPMTPMQAMAGEAMLPPVKCSLENRSRVSNYTVSSLEAKLLWMMILL